MKLYYATDGNLLILMSPHVGFKEWPCHPAEYKGQGPQGCLYIPQRSVYSMARVRYSRTYAPTL